MNKKLTSGIPTLEELGVTRGPWEIESKDTYLVVGNPDLEVAELHPEKELTSVEWADAHLIAAAPDLYEALRGLVEVVKPEYGVDFPHAEINAARQALRKAANQPEEK